MSLGGLPDDFIMRAWAAFRLLCRQLGQTLHGASNRQFYGAGAELRQEEVFPERFKGSTEFDVAGTDEGGGPPPKGIPLWPNLRNCEVVIVASKGVQTGGVDQWQSTCLTGARLWAQTSKPQKQEEKALKTERGGKSQIAAGRKVSA